MVPSSFVPLAALPLNENGKLDRAALPAPAATTVLRASAHVAPRTPIEQALAEVWAAVLGVETVGVDDDYFALGGDSITAIRIAAGLRRHGLALEIRQLLRFPTIAALAPQVTAADAVAADVRPEGEVPLTPIQARFLAEHTIEPAHFNQAVRLRARAIDAGALRAALAAVLDHHDAFRLGFVAGDGGWRQALVPGPVAAPLDVIDLRGRAGWRDAVVAYADRMQRSFDLAVPPLVRAALCRTDEGDDLVLVAHHLVVDGVSWRILIEDLETAYDQALAGEPPRLPAKTHSCQRWAQALHDARGRPDLAAEAAYWRDVLAHPVGDLPSDRGAATSRYGDARVASRRLSQDDTDRLVTRANAAYRTTTEELLLTALARALDRWHGRDTTLIALESHGREEIAPGLDVTRTVGWFTAVFPFALHAPRERDLGYQVKWIKESVRRVPRKGAGYGLLASLDPGPLEAPPRRPEIAVNYLGVFGHAPAGRFRLTTEPAGEAVSARAHRPFAIELAGAVVDGALELAAVYDGARFGETTMARLMDDLVKELDVVARHCAERRRADLTPADLTYSDLTLDELDELLS
jgi:non-ribosomal peptide synthase protein (TIGR01720 family)